MARKLTPLGAGAVAFNFIPREITNSLPKSPAVGNIEARYSIGGGAPDHLPAHGTPRGNKDNNQPRSVTVEGMGRKRYEDDKKTVAGHDD